MVACEMYVCNPSTTYSNSPSFLAAHHLLSLSHCPAHCDLIRFPGTGPPLCTAAQFPRPTQINPPDSLWSRALCLATAKGQRAQDTAVKLLSTVGSQALIVCGWERPFPVCSVSIPGLHASVRGSVSELPDMVQAGRAAQAEK